MRSKPCTIEKGRPECLRACHVEDLPFCCLVELPEPRPQNSPRRISDHDHGSDCRLQEITPYRGNVVWLQTVANRIVLQNLFRFTPDYRHNHARRLAREQIFVKPNT